MCVAECLQKNGYCVLQVPADGEARLSMFEFAHSHKHFLTPKEEFQNSYLGRNSNSKIAWDIGEEENDGLIHYNSYLKKFHQLMMPVSEEFLSISPWDQRMRTMIRTPLESRSEALRLRDTLSRVDVENGEVQDFIDFFQRKRLCMMYMVTGNGGTVELFPREDLGLLDITVNVEKDRLLIFRHDMMSFSYAPADPEDVVLQSWIVDPPKEISIQKFSNEPEPDEEQLEIMGPPPPTGLSDIWTFRADGATVFITSFHCRVGGEVYGDDFSASCAGGIDSSIEVSTARWDPNIYYGKTDEIGKTRTKHACFLADHYLQEVDYKFWEWTEEYARQSTPTAKLVMEIPYMGLVKAGVTRDDLRGQNVECINAWSPGLDSQTGTPPNHLLPYWLGTTGRNFIVDTACSAALVASNLAHGAIAMHRSHMSFISGLNMCIDVGSFIALSGARMISDRGRSFTFDQSGNGYGRGEGICMIVLESSGVYNPIRAQCKQTEPWELIRFVGSATNQDGRSASITAPSGPAQTACIRKSLVEAMIAPPEISFGECHGTGTALGDPIEVGSARICNDPFTREVPMFMGATKTHFGHLELGAGIIGLLRAIVVLTFGTGTPNANLVQVNEHMSLEGFPHYMCVENGAMPFSNNIAGVNSFGFGGTNARAELWGRKMLDGCSGLMSHENKVIRKETSEEISARFAKVDYVTQKCPKCLGLMCWVCGQNVPSTPIASGKHHCSMIRADTADYDVCSICYQGEYQYGEPEQLELGNSGQSVFISGSWSNWSSCQEMKMDSPGVYTCAVRLGATRCEQFQLSTTSSVSTISIHPIVDKARNFIRIEGPDKEGTGKNWLIDGWADGSPEGTVYLVEFTWSATGLKRISWEPTEEMVPDIHAHLSTYYSIAFSEDMLDSMVQDAEDLDTWVSRPYKIGSNGKMKFHFVRNADIHGQTIYPVVPVVNVGGNKDSVQVQGPDNARYGRSFEVRGAAGAKVQMQLHVADGVTSVTAVLVASNHKKTWQSGPRCYALKGTWYEDGGKVFMTPDPDDPTICRGSFRIGDGRSESFQVFLDGDEKKVMYPEIDGSLPGETIVCGPAEESDNTWQVAGPSGVLVEVIMSPNGTDMRHLVLCKAAE